MAGQITTNNTGWFNTGKKCTFPSGVTVKGTPQLVCTQETSKDGKVTDVITDPRGLWSHKGFHDIITGNKDSNVKINSDNAEYSGGGNVTNIGNKNKIDAKYATSIGNENKIDAEYTTSTGDSNIFYNTQQADIKGDKNTIVDPYHYAPTQCGVMFCNPNPVEIPLDNNYYKLNKVPEIPPSDFKEIKNWFNNIKTDGKENKIQVTRRPF